MQMIPALENLYTRFSGAPTATRAAAYRIMGDVGYYLLTKVRENLSGEILHARTGALRDSMQYEVYEGAGGVTARVYSDGSVPYARILETGGVTSPHMIVVKRMKALRYEMAGAIYYSKSVQHPGSRIPAFAYLRMLLVTERPNVQRMIRQGLKDVI